MNISKTFNNALSTVKYAYKKHEPTILIVGGLALVVSAGVYACTQTPKATKAIEGAKKDLKKINECKQAGQCEVGEYSEKDAQQDIAITVVNTGKKLIKAYGPSLVATAAGAAMIIAGDRKHCKRTAAAVQYAGTVAAGWAAYRSNVIDRFGEKVDKELKSGKWTETIDIPEKKDENGNVTQQADTVEVTHMGVSPYSDYARIYDETNPNWNEGPAYNMVKLDRIERICNDMLNVRGYLFLNEVYRELGYEPTAAGQYVGWLSKKRGGKDGYISFNHRNKDFESSCRFMQGYEASVILDFNVDGPILDMLPQI